jgi:phosphomannomutase
MPRRSSLKVGISGVRGVVGELLTPQLVTTFAQAFGTFVGPGAVVVGRDTRVSGEMVKNAVFAGLLAVGCKPVDVGISPVPSILIKTNRTDAIGAIAVTASHNPVQWNALKFVGRNGLFLNRYEAQELLDIYHQSEFSLVEPDAYKPIVRDDDPTREHFSALLQYLDVEAIRKRNFKAVYDSCNGAGSLFAPRFLEMLGCRAVGINNVPDGIFPRDPEPKPENISGLCEAVKEEKADIGFAQDADADRLAIVDQEGRPIGEELTVALAVKHVLARNRGPVVVNLSTTAIVDYIAAEFDCPVIRTRIGEVNVAEAMIASSAVIGGEGNGGVMVPAVHPCRDSFIGMGIALECLAEKGKTVSELVAELPRYVMVKRTVDCSTEIAHSIMTVLRKKQMDAGEVDTRDGLKITYSDRSWVHIRPSNTEAVMRLTAESPSPEKAQELAERFAEEISSLC